VQFWFPLKRSHCLWKISSWLFLCWVAVGSLGLLFQFVCAAFTHIIATWSCMTRRCICLPPFKLHLYVCIYIDHMKCEENVWGCRWSLRAAVYCCYWRLCAVALIIVSQTVAATRRMSNLFVCLFSLLFGSFPYFGLLRSLYTIFLSVSDF